MSSKINRILLDSGLAGSDQFIEAKCNADGYLKIETNATANSLKVWNAASPNVNQTSTALDISTRFEGCIFGTSTANCSLYLQVSDDNVTYYDIITLPINMTANISYFEQIICSSKWIRLKSNTNLTASTITMFISFK